MLYIRRLRYGDTIDASWFVKDGAEHADLSIFRIGDTVTIDAPLTQEQYELLNEMRHALPSIRTARGLGAQNDYHAHLVFTVVKVDHFLALGFGAGTMRRLGHSVALEPADWLTEDVMTWIGTGARPSWADEKG